MPAHTAIRWTTNLVFAGTVLMFALLVLGPQSGRYRTLSILSGSMAPAFETGDEIISVPVAASRVRVGDIISYHAPIAGRPLVTHRVVRVVVGGRSPVVQTRGDGNATEDPWVAKLEAGPVWKQLATIPNLGSLRIAVARSPIHEAPTWPVPLVALFVVLRDIWRTPPGAGEDDAVAGELYPTHFRCLVSRRPGLLPLQEWEVLA